LSSETHNAILDALGEHGHDIEAVIEKLGWVANSPNRKRIVHQYYLWKSQQREEYQVWKLKSKSRRMERKGKMPAPMHTRSRVVTGTRMRRLPSRYAASDSEEDEQYARSIKQSIVLSRKLQGGVDEAQMPKGKAGRGQRTVQRTVVTSSKQQTRRKGSAGSTPTGRGPRLAGAIADLPFVRSVEDEWVGRGGHSPKSKKVKGSPRGRDKASDEWERAGSIGESGGGGLVLPVKEEQGWVMCDECGCWRALERGVFEWHGDFVCIMNVWDESSNVCGVPSKVITVERQLDADGKNGKVKMKKGEKMGKLKKEGKVRGGKRKMGSSPDGSENEPSSPEVGQLSYWSRARVLAAATRNANQLQTNGLDEAGAGSESFAEGGCLVEGAEDTKRERPMPIPFRFPPQRAVEHYQYASPRVVEERDDGQKEMLAYQYPEGGAAYGSMSRYAECMAGYRPGTQVDARQQALFKYGAGRGDYYHHEAMQQARQRDANREILVQAVRTQAAVLTQGKDSAGKNAASSTKLAELELALVMGEVCTPMPCHCKRSKCLKLYCDCFASRLMCRPGECKCVECRNNSEKVNEKERNAALKKAAAQVSKKGAGCNCKNSKCLKKYCDCFAAGVVCSNDCRCLNCLNTAALRGGDSNSTPAATRPGRARANALQIPPELVGWEHTPLAMPPMLSMASSSGKPEELYQRWICDPHWKGKESGSGVRVPNASTSGSGVRVPNASTSGAMHENQQLQQQLAEASTTSVPVSGISVSEENIGVQTLSGEYSRLHDKSEQICRSPFCDRKQAPGNYGYCCDCRQAPKSCKSTAEILRDFGSQHPELIAHNAGNQHADTVARVKQEPNSVAVPSGADAAIAAGLGTGPRSIETYAKIPPKANRAEALLARADLLAQVLHQGGVAGQIFGHDAFAQDASSRQPVPAGRSANRMARRIAADRLCDASPSAASASAEAEAEEEGADWRAEDVGEVKVHDTSDGSTSTSGTYLNMPGLSGPCSACSERSKKKKKNTGRAGSGIEETAEEQELREETTGGGEGAHMTAIETALKMEKELEEFDLGEKGLSEAGAPSAILSAVAVAAAAAIQSATQVVAHAAEASSAADRAAEMVDAAIAAAMTGQDARGEADGKCNSNPSLSADSRLSLLILSLR
jgi:hypothetical protein